MELFEAILSSPLAGAIISGVAAIIAGLIGGLIAGCFSIKAVNTTFKNQKKQQEKNEADLILGLYQAIFDEVDTLWHHFHQNTGMGLEDLKEDEPFLWTHQIGQDYFPVYRGNTFLISQIKDNNLRRAIVRTYTKANAMIDELKSNTDLVQKDEHTQQLLEESQYLLGDQTQYEALMNRRKSRHEACVSYAKLLKKAYTELKGSVSDLLDRLQKELKKRKANRLTTPQPQNTS